MLKHGILGLLNYKEMSGYEIKVAFRDSLNFFGRHRPVKFIESCKT